MEHPWFPKENELQIVGVPFRYEFTGGNLNMQLSSQDIIYKPTMLHAPDPLEDDHHHWHPPFLDNTCRKQDSPTWKPLVLYLNSSLEYTNPTPDIQQSQVVIK